MKLFVLIGLAATPFLAAPAAAVSVPLSPAQRYVACVAQKRPAAVRELLQASSRAEADRPYRSLSEDARCFSLVFGDREYQPDDAAFSIDVLRGRLAEQSLLASWAQVSALRGLPLEQKRYIRPWFAATGRDPSVDEMGACIADTDPRAVMALVAATAGGVDEDQAMAALQPSLGKCLSAGTRLQAGRPQLRAALAEALYQRMISPALSAPAPETPK
jgi:hypothetical protein